MPEGGGGEVEGEVVGWDVDYMSDVKHRLVLHTGKP